MLPVFVFVVFSGNAFGISKLSVNEVWYENGVRKTYSNTYEGNNINYPPTPTPIPSYVTSPLPNNSQAVAQGYASSGNLVMGGVTSAWSNGTVASGVTTLSVENYFTVLPGTSGLAAGDSTTLNLNIDLEGYFSSDGESWSQMYAGLSIFDLTGRQEVVDFGANTNTLDGQEHEENYWAETNTGASPILYSNSYSSPTPIPGGLHTSFSTGALSLQFEAIVGHSLDFFATLRLYSSSYELGGVNSRTSNMFWSTFGSDIAPVDPNIQISWDIPPTTGPAPVPEPSTLLLLGSGLIGVAGLKRIRFKKRAE